MSNTEPHQKPGESEPPETGAAQKKVVFRLSRGEWAVFILVLLFYAGTRLYGIVDFPIYFFCDEAYQANLAQDLVANNFRDEYGNRFPAFFRNVRVFNLGLSVWIHALPVTVFGKTIFTVRATSAMIGLLGAASLMLALKWFFGSRLWWTGGLVMAALPAWFLHSRTAFETAMMVSFYGMFVLAYLLYREVSAWWLPAAIITGAATFYSYSNGQGVMFISGLLLLIGDWRYHWQVIRRHPRAAVTGLAVLLVVAAPYVRFRFFLHPDMMTAHLADLETYWFEDTSLLTKIRHFGSYYLAGLSPACWFTEDVDELVRHRMLGYPHFPPWLAPAMFLGLVVSLLRLPRSPAHRIVLIAVLAAPFSASLVGLRITRTLAMVVPATLCAVVGLDQIRRWMEPRIPRLLLNVAIGLGLTAATVAMTRDALVNGPRWFSNYGLHGMQWGAKELFADLQERIALTESNERFVLSHSWANFPDAFGFFFLGPDEISRISWNVVDELLRERSPTVRRATLFVLTPEEFERAQESPKLAIQSIHSVIPNPAGEPGFYVVRLVYSPHADAIFDSERGHHPLIVEDTIVIDELPAQIRHPELDIGGITDAFDGDLESLARTHDANPAKVEITFSEPRSVEGLRLHLWTNQYGIEIKAVRANGETVSVQGNRTSGSPPEPLDFLFERPVPDVVRLDLHISQNRDEHVHIRQIEILPRPFTARADIRERDRPVPQ